MFGPPKKTQGEAEIWSALWVDQLGQFDRQTLIDAAKTATGKFKFWPSLAEFKAICAEDRKHMAESVGHKPQRPRWDQPNECPLAVEARRRDAELRARQNQLMREARCAPIDWSKPHAAEFARIEPFREAARKELGYVD